MKKTKQPNRGPVVGLRIDPDLMKRFRELCAKNRRTLTAELEMAIEEHLKRAEVNQK